MNYLNSNRNIECANLNCLNANRNTECANMKCLKQHKKVKFADDDMMTGSLELHEGNFPAKNYVCQGQDKHFPCKTILIFPLNLLLLYNRKHKSTCYYVP